MKKNLGYISAINPDKNKNYQIYRFREEAKHFSVNLIEIHPTKTKIAATPSGIKLFNEDDKIIPDCQAVYRKTINSKSALAIQEALIENGSYSLFSEKSRNSREKLFAYLTFAINKLPFPKTFVLSNKDNLDSCLDYFNHQFPLVVKFSKTTHGVGTILVESGTSLNSIIDYLFENKAGDYPEPALVQEYIKESKGRDIRVVVLNDEVIAAVERDNSKKDFRSNVFQGAEVKNIKLNSEQKEVAVKSVKVLGLKFGGVDLMFGKQGPLLTEVNSPCDYSFVEQKTNINITRKIFQALIPGL